MGSCPDTDIDPEYLCHCRRRMMWEPGKIAEGNTRQSPNEVRLWFFFFVSRFNHLGSM